MSFKTYFKDNLYMIAASLSILLIFNVNIIMDVLLAKALGSLIYMNSLAIIFFLLILYFIGYSSYKRKQQQLMSFINKESGVENYPTELVYELIHQKDLQCEGEIANLRNELTEINDYMTNWIHQVKIPIAVLEILSHRVKEMEQGLTLSREIQQEIDRISILLDQALYIARSSHYDSDLLIEEMHIGSAVKEVIRKNKNIFIYNKIALKMDNLDHTILTDKKWLMHIMEQILHNACKYMDENRKPEITIHVEGDEKALYIHIKDNGIGISAGDLNRVFDKGFTGENGRNRTKSTGMGLYIARKMIHKLESDIRIESEKNVGTDVILTFYKFSDYFIERRL